MNTIIARICALISTVTCAMEQSSSVSPWNIEDTQASWKCTIVCARALFTIDSMRCGFTHKGKKVFLRGELTDPGARYTYLVKVKKNSARLSVLHAATGHILSEQKVKISPEIIVGKAIIGDGYLENDNTQKHCICITVQK
jgi:hypothetical protein